MVKEYQSWQSGIYHRSIRGSERRSVRKTSWGTCLAHSCQFLHQSVFHEKLSGRWGNSHYWRQRTNIITNSHSLVGRPEVILSTFSQLICSSPHSPDGINDHHPEFLRKEHEPLLDQLQEFWIGKFVRPYFPLTWQHVNDALRAKGKTDMKASLILTAACSLHAQFLQSRYKHGLDVSWARQLPHAPATSPDHPHSAHIHIYLLLLDYQKWETYFQNNV